MTQDEYSVVCNAWAKLLVLMGILEDTTGQN